MHTRGRFTTMTGWGVALVVWAVLVAAHGQSCVPFEGAPLTRHKCDAVVTWSNVLLLPGQSYDDADRAASELTKLFGVYVPPACRNAALRLVCMGNFVSCHFDTTTGLTYQAPCRSVCEETVAECGAFLAAAGLESKTPDCNATNPLTGGPLYPATNCNNASADVSVAYSQADCPYPTEFTTDGADPNDPSTLCVLTCPSTMFTSEDWDTANGLMITFSALSFILALFMCITWVLNPRKRKFPAFVPFWLALCSFMNAGSILLSILIGGPRKLTCTWDDPSVMMTWDNAGDNDGQGVVCILQAMILVFFAVAGSFWWLTLTFNIFELLVLGMKRELVKKIYYFQHIINWGVPTVCVIIGLAGRAFGGVTANHNCWMASPYDWAAFYSWVLLNLLIGTILVGISLVKIIRVKAKFKQSSIKTEQIIRLGFLVVLYWAVYLYFCIYRLVNETRQDDYKEAFASQIQCSALSGEECPFSGGMNRGMWLIQAMAVGSHGIIIFMVLAFTKETFWFWVDLIQNWRTPMLVLDGSVSRTQTNSTAQSTSRKSAESAEDSIM